jgi:putative ABC transport system permease protein
MSLLVLCLALAVTGRVTVGTLVAGVERTAAQEARGLIGGDLELTSSHPLTAEESTAIATALPAGSRQLAVQGLVTMVRIATPAEGATAAPASAVTPSTGSVTPPIERARPIELSAVPPGYPLVGRLDATAPVGVLEAGQALVQPELLSQLGVAVGDPVTLGTVTVTIAGIIRDEPGLTVSPFSAGPRVVVSLATLERSGLAAHGARIRHVTLVALPDPRRAKAVVRAIRKALGQDDIVRPPPGAMGPPVTGVNVRSAAESQAQAGRFLERFADYVRLAALVSLLLGGIGVASLVRGQINATLDDVAVLRVVGATPRQVQGIFLLQTALLGLAAGVLGSVLGSAGAAAVALGFPQWGLSPWPVLSVCGGGVALGTLTAVLFAGLPLIELGAISPLAILRRDHLVSGPSAGVWRQQVPITVLIAVVLLLLAAWESRSWSTGPAVMATVLGAAGLLLVGGRWVLPWLARLRPGATWLALAVGNLGRPLYRPVAAATAIGLATFLGGTLLVYRASFLSELDPQRSGGVPSLFVIDLQVDQLDDFRAFLASEGLTEGTVLAPVVRARYRDKTAAVEQGTREGEQARFFRNREQNLSYRDELGIGNRIIAGAWIDPHGTKPEASLEEGFAKRLGVDLGSEVTFDIQGVEVSATVTSLRKVDWASFRPNFFVLLSPAALADAPQTWIASLATLADGRRQQVQARLAARFPAVTAFDVTAIGAKVVALIGRLEWTIRLIALLALAAGLVVLVGMAVATAASRREDQAVLLVLGARRRTLLASIAAEFALIGIVAGGGGAALSAAAGWLVVGQVIGLDLSLPWLWLAGLGAAVAVVCAVVGTLACRGVLRASPLAVLRG